MIIAKGKRKRRDSKEEKCAYNELANRNANPCKQSEVGKKREARTENLPFLVPNVQTPRFSLPFTLIQHKILDNTNTHSPAGVCASRLF
jgi:hypothetical protein